MFATVIAIGLIWGEGIMSDPFDLKPNSPVPIWPASMPKGREDHGAETVRFDPRPGQPDVEITERVNNPTLTLFKPKHPNGTAVMVCPGGGYYILASNLEGTEICEWLNSIGVTAIMLRYRVPSADSDRYGPPLQDAQRGLGLIRAQATRLGIDPARIGVMGFSAGGHLSANLGANSARSYAVIDEADRVSCQPDFSMLIYPAYLNDIKLGSATPPTFMVQTVDDPIPVTSTLNYASALAAAKVPTEVHVFPVGGHGYGLRPSKDPVSGWPGLAAAWMKANGWLPSK